MIQDDKQNKAIKAIQDLIIQARIVAFNEHPYPDTPLLNFLNELEYLPALMLEETDQTFFFEDSLEEICQTYDCGYILNKYRA